MDSLFLLGTPGLPRWGFGPQARQTHFAELVARNRGGMVAPENEQRNSSSV